MKRFTSFLTLAALALALTAYAQGTSGTTEKQPGSTPDAAQTPKATEGTTHTTTHKSTTKAPLVDINSASKEDLMKLSGINDATADKIIAARPFKSKSELTSKKLLSSAQYSKIKAHVTAKQEKKSK